MTTITQSELKASLTKIAKSDLACSRKARLDQFGSSEIIITGTKAGNVALRYSHASKRYAIVSLTGLALYVCEAKAGAAISWLVDNYTVILDHTQIT